LLTGERLGRWSAFTSSSLCFFFCYVLLYFCFFFVFLLLPASVSCFSFLLLFVMVAAVVGRAMMAHSGGAMTTLFCGGG
jgi:hypothetical protein